MTKENLSTYRKDIEHLRSLTNEQLKEEYNATDESIKILKMALTENEQFYQKPLSGNIARCCNNIPT